MHAAQYQSIGILAMDWRWYSDRRQFGADEAHGLYNIYPALKVQTQYNIDIVSSRFSLESIADQFADRVWASGQFRPF